METATEQENSRNPDGTFKEGFSGNPGGRPKGSLKSYVANRLAEMTPEQKDVFLKDVAPELIWRMAEGNPQNDITTGGEKLPTPILNELHSHHGLNENTETQEKA